MHQKQLSGSFSQFCQAIWVFQESFRMSTKILQQKYFQFTYYLKFYFHKKQLLLHECNSSKIICQQKPFLTLSLFFFRFVVLLLILPNRFKSKSLKQVFVWNHCFSMSLTTSKPFMHPWGIFWLTLTSA